jgi:ABC-type Zn uptake system ZnuABC Zn-binding protein ZnuA
LFYRFKKLRKMKKLVFMFAAIVAVSFASCGNKAQTAEVDTDSVEVVDSADTTAAVADTVAADSVK